MDDNKSKALSAALSQIEKQFGKGSIMRLGEAEISKDIEVVSTGSLGLDIALGIGGLPRGRVVESTFPGLREDTLTLSVIAEMQKLGGTAALSSRARARPLRASSGGRRAVAHLAAGHGGRLSRSRTSGALELRDVVVRLVAASAEGRDRR